MGLRRMRWLGACALGAAMLSVATPRVARACSCATFAFEVDVRDGEGEVALDFVPLIDGRYAALEFSTGKGKPVEFELREFTGGVCGGHSAELRPKGLLLPETEYVLRARAEDGESKEIHFTTGRARVDASEMPPPEAAAIAFENDTRDSCDSRRYPCLQLPAPDEGAGPRWFEVTFTRAGREVARYLTAPAAPSGRVSFMFTGDRDADCVELRERDAAGRRSEPTVLCGERFPVRPGWITACEAAGADDFPAVVSGAVDAVDAGDREGWAGPRGFSGNQPVGCGVSRDGITDGDALMCVTLALAAALLSRRKRLLRRN